MKTKLQITKKTITFEGKIIPYCKIYLYDTKHEKNETELLKIPPLKIPLLAEKPIIDLEQKLDDTNSNQIKEDVFKRLGLDIVETVRSMMESLENPLQDMGVASYRNNNPAEQEPVSLFSTSFHDYNFSRTTIATYQTGVSANYPPVNYTGISDSFLQGTDRSLQEEQRFKIPATKEIKISFDFDEQQKEYNSFELIPLIQQESSEFFESQLLKITLKNMKIGDPPANNESIIVESTKHQTEISAENFDHCQEKPLIGGYNESDQ